MIMKGIIAGAEKGIVPGPLHLAQVVAVDAPSQVNTDEVAECTECKGNIEVGHTTTDLSA